MDGWMGGWVDRQTDRQIEGWMDRKTDDRYIVFIGNTYVYNIYIQKYLCASVNFTQLLTGLPPVQP